MMTIGDALAYGRFQLSQSPTPELDARLLLEAALGVTHSYLRAHGDEQLSAAAAVTYRQYIARAKTQEPIPHILGTAPFFDFELNVTRDVLIPRPETEQLVELAVAWAKDRGVVQIVDVGTGSGCIPIAIARQNNLTRLTAVDISAAALTVARENGRRLAPGRIQFVQSDLLQPLHLQIDLITANLPYVSDEEWTHLADGVKLFEPSLALQGGVDGLDLIQRLLQQATTRLNPNGAILLEIGWQQGKAVEQLTRTYFPSAHIEIIKDYAGHDRIVFLTA